MKGNWLMPSHKITLLLAAVLAIGACIPGCSKSAGGEEGKEDSEGAKVPVFVRTAVAGPKTLQPVVHVVGRVTLDPASMATLSAPVECVVQSLPVAEGQHVAKDTPVVEMDRRPAEFGAAKAAATLAKARAATDLLKAGPRAEDIEIARQEVLSREIDLQSAQIVAEGKAELRQKDVVSAVEFEEAHRKLRATQAALKSAQAKLALLERGPRPEEIAQAEAELQAAAADDALAHLHLERCTVRSPIEGELVKVAVHPGVALAVAAPIADIVDLRRVLIEAVIPLSRLGDVQIGSKAIITSAAWPEKTFEGKVVRIAHQAEADTGNLAAWIGVDNSDQLLRQDMVVRTAIEARPVEAKVVVPENAVIELDGELIAMLIQDGKTHNVPVKLGKHVDELVEVLEGIHAGDQVITSGGYGLAEGYPVQAEQTSSKSPASQATEHEKD